MAQPYVPTPPNTADAPPVKVAYPYGVKSLSQGTTIYDAMKRLGSTFKEQPLDAGSPYVKPRSVVYEFDGKLRRWDIVESHPSVGVVIYHSGLHAFLIVRQFRPAVYATVLRAAQTAGEPVPSKAEGFTYELCAGLIDKAKSIPQICREEIQEEVGFDVPLPSIQEISSTIASAGTTGSKHIMFFAEVDDSMRQDAGGGLQDHGECIEVLALPFDQVESFVLDSSLPKSPGLMFGLVWASQALASGKLGSGAAKKHVLRARGIDVDNPLLSAELTLPPMLPV